MTRKKIERRGWTVVSWDEPKLVPISWTRDRQGARRPGAFDPPSPNDGSPGSRRVNAG
jgi:hypothetical protein